MAGKVLVTGGTGFIGAGVLRRLVQEDGCALTAAVRSLGASLPAGVAMVAVGGLGCVTDWRPALEGVEVVVHCAARTQAMNETSADPLALYCQINVEGTLALARQAVVAGVRRFVFLSSIKVNGEATLDGRPFRADDVPAPEDAYGISKREAEEGLAALARESGMEMVIIRPPLVYGPGVKGNFALMMLWAQKGVPLPLGAVRHNRRSLVALDNLVDLITVCIDHPAAANQVFLAGDGEDLSTGELLERLAGAMNRRAWLIPVPVWMLEKAAAVLGKRDAARRLCGSLQVDISKARDLLGWTPPVSVDEGLRRSVGGLPLA